MARHDSSDEDIKARSRDRRERERSVDIVDASDEEHRRRRRNRQERERSDRDRPGSNEDGKCELKRDGKDRSRDRRERERSMDMVDSSDEEEDRRLRRNRRERADKDRRRSNEDEKGELKRENKEEDASANGDGKRRERERGHRDLSSDEEDDRANPRRDRCGKDRTRGDGGASDEEDERANPRRDRGGKDRTRGDRGRSDEDDDRANRQRDRRGKDRTCRDRGASDEDDDEANLERDRRGKDRTRRDRGASDEDDDRANPRRDRRDKDRTFGDRGAFDEEEEGEISRREKDTALTEEDREGRLKRDRRDRERGDRHENGYRQRRENDDGYRRKDRHSRRDSESGDRVHKHRDRYSDVRKDKERKEREVGDRGSRKKEERDGTRMEEPKPQKQPAVQEDNALAGSKSGGVYIPPFKLARMMKEVQDKSSVEYQRLTWDALRKSINGLVNKVNASNLKNIIPELFAENLIRGRGLFCRSCMKSQMASPGFTDVFAALVAVVNTKFPEVGDLLLRRIVLQLKRAYKRNDKPQLLAAVKFIAHLVNQQVAHEIIALELLTVLLENPTDDSVEVAVGFVTECGSILQELSPKGLHGIFERFRGILHEGEIDKRVQFLIEGLFAVRKAKFQGHPAVRPELDLVEPEDQLTHEISLQEEIEPEIALDIFRPDSQFVENEKKYEELKKSIIGEESEDDDGSDAGSSDEDDEEEESDEEDEEQMKIQDETETNLVNLRRTIYLTIMSSVDFEEAGHKLLKIKLEPGQEMELCIMLLECCSQERTYLRYYGLLGQRFCMINKIHQENFEKSFVQQYSMIHRLETNKLRNVAKFFAHLLGTDALPWHVLAYIRLTEEDTTSSSRIFIKILFQELSEQLGIKLLNERLQDPTMQDSFDSIFPKDNPKNTRFAINFFTSIGLGGITESLREYLKNMPRLIMQQQKQVSESESESESDSDSASSSGTSDSSDSDTDSASSDSDESERDKRKRRRRN